MKLNIKKIALALGSLAVLTAATSASAFPIFSITPSAIKGTLGPINNLDTIKGGASERLLVTSATTFGGNGLLTLDNFFSGANDVFDPRPDGGFKMYITFSLTDTLTSGTIGAPGSTYAITSLNFKIFADVNGDDLFSVAATGSDPGASNTGDDKLLGFGSLVAGNAVLNPGGGSNGAALNSTESLSLCSGAGTAKTGGTTTTTGVAAQCASNVGTSFFSQPIPFYNLAFDEFNNTSSVFNPLTNELILSGGSGSINFAIPEPGSIALIGIAAVAAGLSTRRRRKAA
jgi:PEP-CTERM motif